MVTIKISQDYDRFRQIVKGRVRRDLRKYLKSNELIGRQGGQVISIPITDIELPRFQYGENQGGVGAGEGEEGDVIGLGELEGPNGAGDQPGDHILEVDFTIEELAQILAEELELPRIQPRGSKNIEGESDNYSVVRNVGIEVLKHRKRTFREALKRQLAGGEYSLQRPLIVPIKKDKRYLSDRTELKPENNAVIFYIQDVSGSMTDDLKMVTRQATFWIDIWIQSHYKNVDRRYIAHDSQAFLVDQDQFYRMRTSGGTAISSAYQLAIKMLEERFSPEEYNVYFFQFSDGDNYDHDSQRCVKHLKETLLPAANLFCYGQVGKSSSSDRFIDVLEEEFPERDNLIFTFIRDDEEILPALKAFLGKGK